MSRGDVDVEGPLHQLLGLFSTAISTADGTVAATCEVERTAPHGPACVSGGPWHIYDCPKACGCHADIWGTQDMVRVYMIRVVSAPRRCSASTAISTSVSPLYIYVASRHGDCKASTSIHPLQHDVEPLQLLYSCSTAIQLYIALHSTTSTAVQSPSRSPDAVWIVM